jgi:hypothetical protein
LATKVKKSGGNGGFSLDQSLFVQAFFSLLLLYIQRRKLENKKRKGAFLYVYFFLQTGKTIYKI